MCILLMILQTLFDCTVFVNIYDAMVTLNVEWLNIEWLNVQRLNVKRRLIVERLNIKKTTEQQNYPTLKNWTKKLFAITVEGGRWSEEVNSCILISYMVYL
jgi:hypothetical protein